LLIRAAKTGELDGSVSSYKSKMMVNYAKHIYLSLMGGATTSKSLAKSF